MKTIRKARELAGEMETWRHMDELIATREAREEGAKGPEAAASLAVEAENAMPSPAQKAAVHAQEAMQGLDYLSTVLGLKITQIYKYIEDQPSYRLKCEKGEMGEIDMGGVQALTEQRVFRDRVAALANHRIPTFKPPEWDKISAILLSSVSTVDLGPEGKTEGMIRSWLDQYFEGLSVQDTIEDADSSKGPFRSSTFGCVCFYLASFQRWATTNHGADRFTTSALLRIFKRIGVHSAVHHCGSTSRSVYKMPTGYVPPRAVPRGHGADVVQDLLRAAAKTDEPDWVTEEQPSTEQRSD
jgi:hypothetical protein